MKECWRWYGPLDTISLEQIAQTGALGIVTALHEIPYGVVWDKAAIADRQKLIAGAGLGQSWEVVESLPIHEDIKRGSGDLTQLFRNYRQSMTNLAEAGIKVICYNFMPLIDWTRTDLAYPLPLGGDCLRFDLTKIAAFDIHLLQREGAEADYSPEIQAKAQAWAEAADATAREELLAAIMAGLPGAYDRYDIEELRTVLTTYAGINRDGLRANLSRFLDEVLPTAEELGIRMCVHPDDPPRSIFGLPRIVSSLDDIEWILNAYDSPANGLTFCSGSLGAGAHNDLPEIVRRCARRIHFAHLRNVARDPDGSFAEAAHLDGDNPMVEIIDLLLQEEARRIAEGEADPIPFRPDHGHRLLDDLNREAHPGYPLIGRMRGLAELRGVIAALSYARAEGGSTRTI